MPLWAEFSKRILTTVALTVLKAAVDTGGPKCPTWIWKSSMISTRVILLISRLYSILTRIKIKDKTFNCVMEMTPPWTDHSWLLCPSMKPSLSLRTRKQRLILSVKTFNLVEASNRTLLSSIWPTTPSSKARRMDQTLITTMLLYSLVANLNAIQNRAALKSTRLSKLWSPWEITKSLL